MNRACIATQWTNKIEKLRDKNEWTKLRIREKINSPMGNENDPIYYNNIILSYGPCVGIIVHTTPCVLWCWCTHLYDYMHIICIICWRVASSTKTSQNPSTPQLIGPWRCGTIILECTALRRLRIKCVPGSKQHKSTHVCNNNTDVQNRSRLPSNSPRSPRAHTGTVVPGRHGCAERRRRYRYVRT